MGPTAHPFVPEDFTQNVSRPLRCLGYVIADVAADGLLVTYAQRESEAERGYVQTTAYLFRAIGMFVSVAIVGLGMNGYVSQTL